MRRTVPDPVEYLRRRRSELEDRYGIRTIRLFGSRARGTHSGKSDIDILVTAQKPYRFDLIALIDLEQNIRSDLGIPVDLILEEDLKPSVAESALKEAISI
ncbi:MAG: nucleotidyltransferase domain-containing protein [Spirochaeta sp.]|jgi:predicted nucleotidyltransferase|nr:nucleotidyltransferase domain-containing protein [Spirochaeta sp.]